MHWKGDSHFNCYAIMQLKVSYVTMGERTYLSLYDVMFTLFMLAHSPVSMERESESQTIIHNRVRTDEASWDKSH